MTSPERFADIVNRHFPRLKEPTVKQPAEPRSAEDHYHDAEELLRCARVALEANDFAREHALTTLARTHYVAAQAAVAIWPADEPGPTALSVALAEAQAELRRWRQAYAAGEEYWAKVSPALEIADSDAVLAGEKDVAIGAGAYRARIRTALLQVGDPA